MKQFFKYLALPFLWIWSKLRGLFNKKVYEQPVNPGLRSLPWPLTIQSIDTLATLKAIEFWNNALKKELFKRAPLNQPSNIDIFYDDYKWEGRDGQAETGGNHATIYIKNSVKDYWPLLAHELGHTLGFKHSEDASSIMYPLTYPFQKVTKIMMEILNAPFTS